MKPYLITSARPAESSRGGQCRKRIGVGEHHARLVEGADHVLAERVVDRGLAADGRIDLREQGRRHLDERDAALIDRRGKAGDVADHTAAQRDDRGASLAAVLEQRIENRIERLPVLVVLAIGQDDAQRVDAGALQTRFKTLQIQRRHDLVGDDGGALLRQALDDQLGLLQNTRADVDRIAALAERDVQGAHVFAPSSRTSSGFVRSASELREFLLEAMHEAPDALVAGVDDEVGDLAVERIAFGVQLGELRERVGCLQKRPVTIVPRALPQIVR